MSRGDNSACNAEDSVIGSKGTEKHKRREKRDLRRQREYSQHRHAARTADENGATSCNTSISFSCAILSLCMWPFASILFTAHPTPNGQYLLDVKNGCNSMWSLICLWMYVIKKNKRFVVANEKALGRNTS